MFYTFFLYNNYMNSFLYSFKSILHKYKACFALFFLILLLPFFACQKQVDFFTYVSELRDNIFLAQQGEFSLQIYSMEKEYPYETDGIKMQTSRLTEIRFFAPSGDKDCHISFQLNGQQQGGDMSYDNVKAQYYYSCPLDVSKFTEISCCVDYGKTTLEFLAKSVKTQTTITPKNALQIVQEEETELFKGMTDKYGFSGEIYLRLIYEENPYYYVGIIDRNGKVNAFLLNAESGKILAKRQI